MSVSPDPLVVRVVAAALYDSRGRVLLADRPAGRHMAGRWEFPGGKIGADEPARDALGRELREELGVEVDAAHPLMRLRHRYDDRTVELDFWVVDAWRGEPAGLEGQRLAWVAPAELPDWDILEADGPFVEAIMNGTASCNGASS